MCQLINVAILKLMTKDNFVKTIWYRSLKAIFLVVFFGGISGIAFFTINEWPKGPTYYFVECSNGKIIEADLRPTFKIPGERVDHANIRCSSTTLTQDQRKMESTYRLDGPDLAYDYSVKYRGVASGKNAKWFAGATITSIVWILILWFVKRLFDYIAFGENFFKRPRRLFD